MPHHFNVLYCIVLIVKLINVHHHGFTPNPMTGKLVHHTSGLFMSGELTAHDKQDMERMHILLFHLFIQSEHARTDIVSVIYLYFGLPESVLLPVVVFC